MRSTLSRRPLDRALRSLQSAATLEHRIVASIEAKFRRDPALMIAELEESSTGYEPSLELLALVLAIRAHCETLSNINRRIGAESRARAARARARRRAKSSA